MRVIGKEKKKKRILKTKGQGKEGRFVFNAVLIVVPAWILHCPAVGSTSPSNKKKKKKKKIII
ncbi:conserved hypothetical protein [Ricinus communis]|uniref:Uncharacterized protein n=1 Tax=Ricinus communis TaxID=3988 RepID=B9S7A7_RICCO|nr:conserved hypothetical protein [Ricinus communis]